jgi:hypothetical protein
VEEQGPTREALSVTEEAPDALSGTQELLAASRVHDHSMHHSSRMPNLMTSNARGVVRRCELGRGIDSGIRHSVGGSDYGSVRVGAFMGKRLVGDLAVKGRQGDVPVVSVHSPAGAGVAQTPGSPKRQKVEEDFYLAAVPPHEYERAFAAQLPVSLVGDRFLAEVRARRYSAFPLDGGRPRAMSMCVACFRY